MENIVKKAVRRWVAKKKEQRRQEAWRDFLRAKPEEYFTDGIGFPKRASR